MSFDPATGLETASVGSAGAMAILNANTQALQNWINPAYGWTAQQSGVTITASPPAGATSLFTADDVGMFILFSDGTNTEITGFTNGTTVSAASATIGDQPFILYDPAAPLGTTIARGLLGTAQVRLEDGQLSMWSTAENRHVPGPAAGGFQNCFFSAKEFFPTTTNGATSEQLESPTYAVNRNTWKFVDGSTKYIQGLLFLPKDVDFSQLIRIRVVYEGASTSSNAVVWSVAVKVAVNDLNIDDIDWDPAPVVDGVNSTAQWKITNPIDFSSLASATDPCVIPCRVARLGGDGSDTYAFAVNFLGLIFEYQRVKTSPAAWA